MKPWCNVTPSTFILKATRGSSASVRAFRRPTARAARLVEEKASRSGRRQTWRSWAPSGSRSLTRNASWTNGWGRSGPAAGGARDPRGSLFPVADFLTASPSLGLCFRESWSFWWSGGDGHPSKCKWRCSARNNENNNSVSLVAPSPLLVQRLRFVINPPNYSCEGFYSRRGFFLTTPQTLSPFLLFSFVHNTSVFGLKAKGNIIWCVWRFPLSLSSHYRDVSLVLVATLIKFFVSYSKNKQSNMDGVINIWLITTRYDILVSKLGF